MSAYLRLPLREFIQRCHNPEQLVQDLEQAATNAGRQHSLEETQSWRTSLPVLGTALTPLQDHDIGVLIEYPLPGRELRADIILTGRNAGGRDCAVVLEDKAWTLATPAGDGDPARVTAHGRTTDHPVTQTERYLISLLRYHALAAGGMGLSGVVFMHNMPATSPLPPITSRFVIPAFHPRPGPEPAYVSGPAGETELTAHLTKAIGHGGGLDIARQFDEAGAIQPPDLFTQLLNAVNGNPTYRLIGKQFQAFKTLTRQLDRLPEGQSHVFLLAGHAGTGKTVVAIRLISHLLGQLTPDSPPGDRVMMVIPGLASRLTLQGSLSEAGFEHHSNLIGSAPQQNRTPELLIIDEAHRLRQEPELNGARRPRGYRSFLQRSIEGARITLVMYDERQVINPAEGVSREQIIDAATRAGAGYTVLNTLTEQLRCNSNTYLHWLDHLLYGDTPPDAVTDYDLQLTTSPHELTAYCDGPSDRIVAGFCWPWNRGAGARHAAEEIELPVPDGSPAWRRRWNLAPTNRPDPERPHQHLHVLWHRSPKHRDEVGCVYTCQNLQFPKTGVIWGEDLVWRTDRWVAQPDRNHDPRIRHLPPGTALPYLLNTYRVLLTRGETGTALHILDPETQTHIQQEWQRIHVG